MANLTKNTPSIQETQAPAPVNGNGNGNVQTTIKSLLERIDIKKKFQDILKERANSFMASIIQVTMSNTSLAKADPMSILSAAMIAATLHLEINPNLGYAYIIPYKDKSSIKPLAQFQIGYKGYIQLALRTNQYNDMNVCKIYEGELKSYDRLTGEVILDYSAKKSNKIIGFVAYFKMKDGFTKYDYMTTEEVTAHAMEYSKSYDSEYGQWKKNFEGMGRKTVLKRLLKQWAKLSTEEMMAIEADQAVTKLNKDGQIEYTYIDNDQNESPIAGKPAVEMPRAIQQNETIAKTNEPSADGDDIADDIFGGK